MKVIKCSVDEFKKSSNFKLRTFAQLIVQFAQVAEFFALFAELGFL